LYEENEADRSSELYFLYEPIWTKLYSLINKFFTNIFEDG